jgi:hypothetical protein
VTHAVAHAGAAEGAKKHGLAKVEYDQEDEGAAGCVAANRSSKRRNVYVLNREPCSEVFHARGSNT